jgi:hypothetical protein
MQRFMFVQYVGHNYLMYLLEKLFDKRELEKYIKSKQKAKKIDSDISASPLKYPNKKPISLLHVNIRSLNQYLFIAFGDLNLI